MNYHHFQDGNTKEAITDTRKRKISDVNSSNTRNIQTSFLHPVPVPSRPVPFPSILSPPLAPCKSLWFQRMRERKGRNEGKIPIPILLGVLVRGEREWGERVERGSEFEREVVLCRQERDRERGEQCGASEATTRVPNT